MAAMDMESGPITPLAPLAPPFPLRPLPPLALPLDPL